jgi:hypothetical protein
MNIGTAITVCMMWTALALIMLAYRVGPFGVAVCVAIGALATGVIARIKI